MTPLDPNILTAVPIGVASERSGLAQDEILLLTTWEEPSGLDASGPMEPVIRSYPTDGGLRVSLADAILVAPAFRAIAAQEGQP